VLPLLLRITPLEQQSSSCTLAAVMCGYFAAVLTYASSAPVEHHSRHVGVSLPFRGRVCPLCTHKQTRAITWCHYQVRCKPH
jgi:hypothetical protein